MLLELLPLVTENDPAVFTAPAPKFNWMLGIILGSVGMTGGIIIVIVAAALGYGKRFHILGIITVVAGLLTIAWGGVTGYMEESVTKTALTSWVSENHPDLQLEGQVSDLSYGRFVYGADGVTYKMVPTGQPGEQRLVPVSAIPADES